MPVYTCPKAKQSACNAGDPSLIPGSGRSTGDGIGYPLQYPWASLVAQLVKKSACNAEDLGLIPGLERSSGEGKGYPLQYSGLENSMDCIVCGVAKSLTRLSDFQFKVKHCKAVLRENRMTYFRYNWINLYIKEIFVKPSC